MNIGVFGDLRDDLGVEGTLSMCWEDEDAGVEGGFNVPSSAQDRRRVCSAVEKSSILSVSVGESARYDATELLKAVLENSCNGQQQSYTFPSSATEHREPISSRRCLKNAQQTHGGVYWPRSPSQCDGVHIRCCSTVDTHLVATNLPLRRSWSREKAKERHYL